MRSMRSVVVLVALLAGCGDNLDLDRCLPTGFADGETMLSGATLGPFARAMQVPATSATLPITYAFVLDEAEGACGEPGASGRRLVIDFCDAPTEAAYAIVPPSQLACPNGAVAVVEEADGTDVIKANAGTVTITQAGVCLTGTYSLTFGGDMIEGGFDVAVCE
jgi:hypothetical protein